MKYYASCSFGKDSIATVLLALIYKEPLDAVIYSEVMFDHSRNISGEHPEHIDWVKNVAIPKLENMNIPVHILKAKSDYVSIFQRVRGGRSKYCGKIYGFPLGRACAILPLLKLKPIKEFLNSQNSPITQYVGIAADETKRLERLDDYHISLLAKYGYTEKMALELCKEYGLLSPIYNTSSRGGCWFCPNATLASFSTLRRNHPELWNELINLSKTPNQVANGFKYGISIEEYSKKLDDYDKKQKLINNINKK